MISLELSYKQRDEPEGLVLVTGDATCFIFYLYKELYCWYQYDSIKQICVSVIIKDKLLYI